MSDLYFWSRFSAAANWCSFIITPVQRGWNSTKSLLGHPLLLLPLPVCLSRVQLTIWPLVTAPSTGQVQQKLHRTFKKASGLTFPCFPSLLTIRPLENDYLQSGFRPWRGYSASAVVGMTRDGKRNGKLDPLSWGLYFTFWLFYLVLLKSLGPHVQ